MNKNVNHEEKSIVKFIDGRAITTTLIIGDLFGCQNKTIVKYIESLKCSPEFFRFNFKPAVHKHQSTNDAHYEITRNGFALIAPLFIEPDDNIRKERFLAEFDRLEGYLTLPKTKLDRTPGRAHADLARHFRASLSIAKNAGLTGSLAVVRANSITKKRTGFDCLEMVLGE